MPGLSGGNDTGIKIDGNGRAIAAAFASHGKVYRKVTEVRARRALRETAVKTVLADGTEETHNVAGPGDYIVTGAGGERWVVKPETFEARYEPKRDRKTVYAARGQVIAVKNPFGRPVSIMAPWKERQHGAADCMIADVLDPATGRRAGEPYLIARAEFGKTYKQVRMRKRK
jgi:hypothetical protein